MFLKLPVPPSTNELYVYLRKGNRRVASKKYVSWRMISALMLAGQTKVTFQTIDTLTISIHPNKRRDIDNYAKATLDLLVGHGIMVDDRIVKRLVIERDGTVPPDEAYVSIEGEFTEWTGPRK